MLSPNGARLELQDAGPCNETEARDAIRVVAAFEAAAAVDAAAGGLYWPETALPYDRSAILHALRSLWICAQASPDARFAEDQAWRILALTHALGSYVAPAAATRMDSAARRILAGDVAGEELGAADVAELRAALAGEAALLEKVTAPSVWQTPPSRWLPQRAPASPVSLRWGRERPRGLATPTDNGRPLPLRRFSAPANPALTTRQ